ncbi:MAG: 50S ribosomal protein L10 [Candidatus Omnitrophica bacterium]|nr:50S ribosomal protein L10 [Candidatus Omnitrophota bacterium]
MTAGAAVSSQDKKLGLGREVRTAWVRELDQALTEVESVVVAKIGKVSTRELNNLRHLLEPVDGSFHVVKNSLCRIAFRSRGWDELDSMLEGTCAITPIRGDAAAACKILVQFSKTNEGFVVRGGRIGSEVLQSKDIGVLANLPSRQVLLAQVAAVAQSPMRNLAVVLQAPIRALALVLNAVKNLK